MFVNFKFHLVIDIVADVLITLCKSLAWVMYGPDIVYNLQNLPSPY